MAGSSIQASGTAVEGEVLLDKTFSNASGGRGTGSMPNRGAADLYAWDSGRQTIPAGYHNGSGTVVGDTALTAGNIRDGANIFGVAGSFIQASGTVVAGEVLLGKTFSNAGAAGTGSMPNRGALTLTPGTAAQTIPAGYHNGSGTVVGDTALTAGNIRDGATIFGVAGSSIQASGTAVAGEVLLGKTFSNAGGAGTGSMPNRGALTLTPGTADQTIPAGYHNGSGTVVGDTALTAGNIRDGATIFGVAGSSKQASGTAVEGEVLLDKTFSNASGGGDREHAEPRRRDVDAWDGGPNDSGGVSQWFRHGRRGHGPDGGKHQEWGEHLQCDRRVQGMDVYGDADAFGALVRQRERDHKGYDHGTDLAEKSRLGRAKEVLGVHAILFGLRMIRRPSCTMDRHWRT